MGAAQRSERRRPPPLRFRTAGEPRRRWEDAVYNVGGSARLMMRSRRHGRWHGMALFSRALAFALGECAAANGGQGMQLGRPGRARLPAPALAPPLPPRRRAASPAGPVCAASSRLAASPSCDAAVLAAAVGARAQAAAASTSLQTGVVYRLKAVRTGCPQQSEWQQDGDAWEMQAARCQRRHLACLHTLSMLSGPIHVCRLLGS